MELEELKEIYKITLTDDNKIIINPENNGFTCYPIDYDKKIIYITVEELNCLVNGTKYIDENYEIKDK